MIYGKPPFDNEEASTPFGSRGTIRFPPKDGLRAEDANMVQDMVTQLLNPNPKLRLGCLKNGIQDVKSHPFFSDLDWEALVAKKITPPFIPFISSSEDLSNFTEQMIVIEDEEDDPSIIDPAWADIDF